MTQAIDARGVNSDRVDQDRRRWPVALAALVVGLVVGGLLGGLYAAAGSATYTATTALSVLPDPAVDITSQNGTDSTIPTQDATSFIQSQLVVINGPQLADQVRAAASLNSAPDVVATQVGQTYVVQVSATAGSRSQAIRVAELTGQAYARIRTRQLGSEIDGLLTSTNQQLGNVRQSLGPVQGNGTALTPAETALQTEYERLLSVRSSLEATSSQASKIVSVVSPAHAVSPGLSTGTRDALAGAVLGAILALLLLVVVRRSVPRIRNAGDLAALDVPVLLPVQPRRSLSTLRRGALSESSEARLLAARLHAGPLGQHQPLVVVGANPGVGASLVAASVAASLVGRGPVLLVRTGAAAVEPEPEDDAQPSGSSAHEQSAASEFDPAASESVASDSAAFESVASDSAASGSAASGSAASDSAAGPDFYLDLDTDFSATDSTSSGSPGTASSVDGDEVPDWVHELTGPHSEPWPAAEVHDPVLPAHERAARTGLVRPSTVPGVWLLTVPEPRDGTHRAGPPVRPVIDVVDSAHRAGWLVVVDAEPVSRSDIALDCARDGAVLALVAGRGRSAPAAVLAAAELFEADRTSMLGVVLNDVPGPLGRLVARRLGRAVQAAKGGATADIDTPPWLPEPRSTDPHPRTTRSGDRPRPSANGARPVARHAVVTTRR